MELLQNTFSNGEPVRTTVGKKAEVTKFGVHVLFQFSFGTLAN